MKQKIAWLPPLTTFDSFGGDWNKYLQGLYSIFETDFIFKPLPKFSGKRMALKRHPLYEGKEATFWHMISVGKEENDRNVDLRRCERLGWIRPIIEKASENAPDNMLKVWKNIRSNQKRRNELRICLWLEEKEFLVILAERTEYILPWTAYLVQQKHQKKKLQKEFEKYTSR